MSGWDQGPRGSLTQQELNCPSETRMRDAHDLRRLYQKNLLNFLLRIVISGLYWDKGKENGNYYLGVLYVGVIPERGGIWVILGEWKRKWKLLFRDSLYWRQSR